jgi:MFS family permease
MRRLTSNPWIVCLAAASFFFYQYIQITIFNVLKPDLMVAFDTTSSALSLLSSLYFYGTVLFLIPAGILLDYLSTRTIILMAMALSLVGLGIFITANTISTAGIGRFLIGISGGPFCFLSTMRLASRWFPEERLAFVTGIIVAVAMLGGIISQAPFIYLVDAFGWRYAMYLNLMLGVVIAGIIYLYIYDYPEGKEEDYKQQIKFYREIGFVKGLKIVVLKLQNWYCGIFASLLNLPIFVLGALWGLMYLTQIFNLERMQASWVCSMLFFGMLVGAPVFGFISDTLHLRKVPMLAGSLICFISVLIVIDSSHLSYASLMLLFFLIGFGSSAQILAYPTVTESNPLALTGSALGLSSTLIMSGGAIFQPIVGWLIEMKWDKLLEDGLPVYSAANYKFALWIMPISILIAGSMVLLIKETYCKRREFSENIQS